MDDDTKSAISDMQSAVSLHESRQDSADSSDSEQASNSQQTAPPSKYGLVIDDSKLEKTIQMILDRVASLEVILINILHNLFFASPFFFHRTLLYRVNYF